MLNLPDKRLFGSRLCPRRKQQGATLLVFMLLMITGTSYMLVRSYNSNIQKIESSKEANLKLKLAKQALIGYAVTYPDNVNAAEGPGYLLCPDTDNDGIAESNCSLAGGTTVGRFPWKTLELFDLYDTSGQTIWFALSENYRYGPNKQIPLNSENAGQLSVDGIDDIVVVLFAPGEPVNNQNRTAGSNLVSHYLEDDNADGDTSFVTTLAAPNVKRLDGIYDANDSLVFNDKLVYITRQELMQAVEKRVLGEVSQVLGNYFNTYGAYPWLSPFADPKAISRNIQGSANSGSSATLLIDSGQDFLELGVAAGDVVYNITDSSIGIVSVNPTLSDRLTVTSLQYGDENDFDEDDQYYVVTRNRAAVLTATTTSGSSGTSLRDSVNNLSEIHIGIGDIVDNISDGSSGIITSISSNQIDVDSLSGGTNNVFAVGDTYQIRTNTGMASAASTTQLQDTSKDFVAMGVQADDLIWNMTDDSFARVTTVANNTLGFDEIIYGAENDVDTNDDYQLGRFDSVIGTREGLLSLHEVGMPFKTGLQVDWTITPNAGDIVVTNSNLLLTYTTNYVTAGSEAFDDAVGICFWSVTDMADCYGYDKNFVSISGRITAGTDTANVIDANATFQTDDVKRGDIVQNYDDESFVGSGTVDAGTSGTATAGSSGFTLEDTNNNFNNINVTVGTTITNLTDGSSGTVSAVSANQLSVFDLSGGASNDFSTGDDYQLGGNPQFYDASADFSIYERYSFVVQNQTQESDFGIGKIQGVLVDRFNNNHVEVESYEGESNEPIIFRPGDTYYIFEPRNFVVETVSSETLLTTDNYESGTNPDFDYFGGSPVRAEYYRVMPAANSISARVDSVTGTWPDRFVDTSADFINAGVEVGDIVENHAGAFGEITAVTATSITTTLYGGGSTNFSAGSGYIIYYDYVFSREHIIRTQFRGNQNTTSVAEVRNRDVCLGYNSDCTSTATAVNFSGTGNELQVTVRDYQEDETTQIGDAVFTPSTLSSGNLRVSNIKFNLAESNADFPSWFTDNDWHKLVYIAYSGNDAPGAASVCTAGSNCLTLNGASLPGNNNRALLVVAGNETTSLRGPTCNVLGSAVQQDRTSGLINAYFELENCDAADDSFTLSGLADDFNDQIRVLGTSP